MLSAPNGVPVINIQTPSAAGVSRNTYRQFDVSAQGVILNNSRTNVQSQIGGLITGNPWLAAGSARVILNEVNSSNPSYLNGPVEIAGQRAEFVLANPAGISVNDSTFINASAVTLTTGTPQFGAGIRADGGLATTGDLRITTTGALQATGTNVAAGALSLQGASIDLAGSQTSSGSQTSAGANLSIAATRGDVTTAGATVTAADALTVSAQRSFDNAGGHLTAGSSSRWAQPVTSGTTPARCAATATCC